jgi:hypothetical protein
MLSYATPFRRKQGVIKNFGYLGEFKILENVGCNVFLKDKKNKFQNHP